MPYCTETVQFDIRHALVNSHSSLRAINFTWNLLNISECTIIPDQYTVFLSCGSCPTTGITKDSVICTDVPLETELCVFLLVPTICGSVSYNSSAFVDIQLKPTKGTCIYIAMYSACVYLQLYPIIIIMCNNWCIYNIVQSYADSISTRHMGLLAACVLLTIIIVMLLTLICIALLLRFKRILPCWNQFL